MKSLSPKVHTSQLKKISETKLNSMKSIEIMEKTKANIKKSPNADYNNSEKNKKIGGRQ